MSITDEELAEWRKVRFGALATLHNLVWALDGKKSAEERDALYESAITNLAAHFSFAELSHLRAQAAWRPDREEIAIQRADDDCTICAIAALTGLSYERVMAVASSTQGGYRYGGTRGTMSPKAVLFDLGFQAERIPGAYIKPRVLWGRRAILSLPSLNGFDGHHDVYWNGREICDPSPKEKYPADLGSIEISWAVVVDELARLRALEGWQPDREEIARIIDSDGWAFADGLRADAATRDRPEIAARLCARAATFERRSLAKADRIRALRSQAAPGDGSGTITNIGKTVPTQPKDTEGRE